MAYEKHRLHPWRERLTPDEEREVAEIETAMGEHASEKAALAARLSPIRNRAIQRCRYVRQTT